MSSVRTSRTRLLTTAAALAIGALSLTACDDGSGVRAEDASPSTSSTASPSASPGSGSSSQDDAKTGADAKPTANGTAAPGNGKTGTGGSGGSGRSHKSGGKAVTCQGSNTKTVAAPLNRPVNHMLLTVTNTGSKTCYLYTYPAVQFGEAQSVPPVIEASKPQAVVTLAPGESGYASVNLSSADGSGKHGHTVKSLTVHFQGRTADEDVPSAAHPSLPAKGVYVDNSLKVTYWQQSMDTAIDW
ncbi:DUF4232 domain-containing protein [Streptomyces hygroscopicus]|uniref:DUF4232 domain-containing protein n=1 Tax=Streptomyces hygroscopicus TaxID=1912 RepID=UPI00340E9966